MLPIAGDQITNDIAAMLRTPTPDAEEIKLRHGVAKQVLASPDESVEVPGLGDRGPRQVKRQALGAVIEPRVEELSRWCSRWCAIPATKTCWRPAWC